MLMVKAWKNLMSREWEVTVSHVIREDVSKRMRT